MGFLVILLIKINKNKAIIIKVVPFISIFLLNNEETSLFKILKIKKIGSLKSNIVCMSKT